MRAGRESPPHACATTVVTRRRGRVDDMRKRRWSCAQWPCRKGGARRVFRAQFEIESFRRDASCRLIAAWVWAGVALNDR